MFFYSHCYSHISELILRFCSINHDIQYDRVVGVNSVIQGPTQGTGFSLKLKLMQLASHFLFVFFAFFTSIAYRAVLWIEMGDIQLRSPYKWGLIEGHGGGDLSWIL